METQTAYYVSCGDCGRLVPEESLIRRQSRYEINYYCSDCAGPVVIYDDDLGDY